MKLPSSSSLVAAALIASSSIPCLAAPAAVPSNGDMAISSDNQSVASHSKNIVHSKADKDEVHKEDDGGSKKGLLGDLIGKLFCILLKQCDPPKDKGPEHEKRFEKADPQTSRSLESPLPREPSNSGHAGQPSGAAFN